MARDDCPFKILEVVVVVFKKLTQMEKEEKMQRERSRGIENSCYYIKYCPDTMLSNTKI